MAKIRVRLELNKGRTGAPLAKLGRIAEQADKFLSSLASDCDIDAKPGEWLAVNFRNGSVSYDAEFQGEVNEAAAEIYSKSLMFVVDFDPDIEGTNGVVKSRSLLEYSKIGSLIDPDEVIGIGIYHPGSDKPKWRRISYNNASRIRAQLETPLPGYGSVQGIVHAWYKESRDPYFSVRELSTDTLVRCHYSPSLYADVARVVQERNTVIVAEGAISYDRASRAPIDIRAERIMPVAMLSGAEFERFFGSVPGYTGDLTTDEYIDSLREDA